MSKLQKLVVYTNPNRGLFYVSMVDKDKQRFDYEVSIDRQVNRAQTLWQRAIKDNDHSSALRSGWMFALINTDFVGWHCNCLPTVYVDVEEADKARVGFIEQYEKQGFTFVGSHRSFIKGEVGAGGTPRSWTIKFNVSKMSIKDIKEKTEFIFKSLQEEIPSGLFTKCYLAIVAPETSGPRFFNYGAYQVEDMSTLFRFIRNCLGKDL